MVTQFAQMDGFKKLPKNPKILSIKMARAVLRNVRCIAKIYLKTTSIATATVIRQCVITMEEIVKRNEKLYHTLYTLFSIGYAYVKYYFLWESRKLMREGASKYYSYDTYK